MLSSDKGWVHRGVRYRGYARVHVKWKFERKKVSQGEWEVAMGDVMSMGL